MIGDEVEHGAQGLVTRPPQAATQLLQEQRRALSRAKQQEGVDVRHINPFVKQVDREYDVHAASGEIS